MKASKQSFKQSSLNQKLFTLMKYFTHKWINGAGLTGVGPGARGVQGPSV